MRCVALVWLAMVLLQAEDAHIKAAVGAYQAGTTALQQRDFRTAVTSFKKAIEIEPTYMEPRRALIRAYLDSGQRTEAATSITQLLEIEPEDVRDRIALGKILLDSKQTQRALAQFSLALQEEAFNADALFGFATAAKSLGMNDRAQDAFEAGRKHYPFDKRFQPLPSSGK